MLSYRATLARARERWAGASGNARGAALMVLATLGLAGMAVCMKWLGQTMEVWEVLALRAFFALVVLSPALVRAGPRVMVTRRLQLHLVRSAFGLGGIITLFLALTHLDLALVTTLGFTRVLFMVLLAVLFLDETIRWRRTLATGAGFLGVIVCVQPGAEGFEPWTLVALASALFGSGVTTTVKRLTSSESPLTILTYAYLVMGGVAAVPALWNWRNPTLEELLVIIALGICSAFGQSCMVNALRAGEVTAVTPFEYTRLLWAAALGFVLFGEVPGVNTWLGGAIIVAATLYIALREARLRQTGATRRGP